MKENLEVHARAQAAARREEHCFRSGGCQAQRTDCRRSCRKGKKEKKIG